jgi:hypothetical protein
MIAVGPKGIVGRHPSTTRSTVGTSFASSGTPVCSEIRALDALMVHA